MKNSILPHAIWLLVAAGAFAGGMAFKSGNSSNRTADGDVNVNIKGSGGISALGKNSKSETEKEGSQTANAAGGLATKLTASQLLDAYNGSNDDLEKNLLFAQLLLSMNKDNAADIYESMRGKLNGREGMQQMSLLLQAWGKIDGPAAIEAAVANAGGGGGRGGDRGPGGRGGGGGMGPMAVLSGWATADADAAKEWLGTVEDDRQKSFYTFGLVSGLAKTDPAAATDFVLDIAAASDGETQQRGPFGDITTRYIDQIAEAQLNKGFDVASDWADALPEGNMKASAFDEIAEAYVRDDLDAAKDWVAQHAESDYARQAIGEVAEGLARQNPETAIEWAATLPENAQGNVYSEAMQTWTRNNAQEASEYLATMDASPSKDAAIGSFATELARARDEEVRDPASAATWAATIEDESARTETLTDVARSWMRSDAEAATTWLSTSGLPQETQTQIISTPTRDGDRRRGGR